MTVFLITVTQVSKKLHRSDDNPAGKYFWDAEDEDKALDEFHATVPIGCLEDFDIHIEKSADPNRNSPACANTPANQGRR